MASSNTNILIKRSTANGTPGILKSGELAWSYASDTLFIGNSTNDGYINIGTKQENMITANGYGSQNQTIDGQLTISGNLIVQGTATYIDTVNLIAEEPIIFLAANNTVGDSLDIGFTGQYNNGAANVWTGLVRHAGDGDKRYHLFNEYTGNPRDGEFNIVTANAQYATLQVHDLVLANGTSITDTAGSANVYIKFLQENSTGNIAYYDPTTGEVSYGRAAAVTGSSNGSYSWYVCGTNGDWVESTNGAHLRSGNYSVGLGWGLDETNSNTGRVAVGYSAGASCQGSDTVAIGNEAGYANQHNAAVAVGHFAGKNSQGCYAVALGNQAGQSCQQYAAVAIGGEAGQCNQGIGAVAVGYWAGKCNQRSHTVAIGTFAGQVDQSYQSIAIGYYAGATDQEYHAIAIGQCAGNSNQGCFAVALGDRAGKTYQGYKAVAVGACAGANSQQNFAVALGYNSGQCCQQTAAIAVGHAAGEYTQGNDAIAIGRAAGRYFQEVGAIAIGTRAGWGCSCACTGQGSNSIAIGSYAGKSQAAAGSIILNSSGSELNAGNSGFYVSATRYEVSQNPTYDGIAFYNSSTKEFSYSYALDGGSF